MQLKTTEELKSNRMLDGTNKWSHEVRLMRAIHDLAVHHAREGEKLFGLGACSHTDLWSAATLPAPAATQWAMAATKPQIAGTL